MSKEYTGRIIKGIAGFYYVNIEDFGVVTCKAKGAFRNLKMKPLVGDKVQVEIIDEHEMTGNVVDIIPRANSLIRPAVANIDQALVVFAVKEPDPHLNLLDRFLVIMEKQNIPVIIAFNKTDLTEDTEVSSLRQIYEKAQYKTFALCVKTGEGLSELREALEGKTTVLAGPSGVGKSSLMNFMQPEALMETGSLSEKIKRGKNTTRHTELIYVSKNTYMLDTPGFSSLYIEDCEPGDLYKFYPDFVEHEAKCKFTGCAHIKEKECGVKMALEEGLIAKERYDNYCKIYTELANTKKY